MFDRPWSLPRPSRYAATATGDTWAPKVDVVEKDNRLIARVDLPGVKKEDVSVEVADGQLMLSGERKSEMEETKDNVYRAEREYGSFCRMIALPPGVKHEDVKASFANGVLEVTVPMPAAAKPNGKRIEIKDATAPGVAA